MVMAPTPPGTGVMAPATLSPPRNPHRRPVWSCPRPLDAVDAHIDHGGARLDPVGLDEYRLADGRDQNIGAARERRQIARTRMRHRDRGVRRQQQLRRRLAEQQRAADHQRFLARDVADIFLEQQHHPRRRAGDQMGAARQQEPGIDGRQRVHILGRIEHIQHRGFIQMLGQRQLHQDAMHRPSSSVRAPWRAGPPGWCRPEAPTCTDLKPSASAVLPLFRT